MNSEIKEWKLIPKERAEEIRGMPLSFRLQRIRLWQGCTQMQFAKMVGVSQTTVAAWELGRNIPNDSRLEQIRLNCGLPMDYFIDAKIVRLKLGRQKRVPKDKKDSE